VVTTRGLEGVVEIGGNSGAHPIQRIATIRRKEG
jgi:hypothetical protein